MSIFHLVLNRFLVWFAPKALCVAFSTAFVSSFSGATIFVSGIDIVDGTPVLDIKPYVSAYDMPQRITKDITSKDEKCDNVSSGCNEDQSMESDAYAANWLTKCNNDLQLTVEFTSKSLRQLALFHHDNNLDDGYKLEFLQSTAEARQAITDVLIGDPRSAYRRKSCKDRLYYFICDSMHITCWFDDNVAEVLKVQPVSSVNLEEVGVKQDA